MVVIVSQLAYSGAFNSPKTKNAFVFLVVPFISWTMIMLLFLVHLKTKGRNKDQSVE
jgi:hypothetical protein